MPGSCESETNSSPSLISSLRQFRFQNKTKRYQPGSSGVLEASKQSTSNKPVVNGTQKLSENLSFPVAATSSAPSNVQSYSPLSYRKYEISENSVFLLQCLNSKIKSIFKNSNANTPLLELKLTSEEFTKLKEICSRNIALSEKWAANVSENSDVSNVEKVLKVKRPYLHELLKCISDKTKQSSLNFSGISVADSKTPVKTYSRAKNSCTNSDQILTLGKNSSQLQHAGTNSNIRRLSDSHPRGAMDEYEVFCEKEQNLRKLLDAFPGADIMEAQDILVKCNWDLKKAIEVSRTKPPRTTRKRSFSQVSPYQAADFQGVSGNAQVNSGTSQKPTNVTEEIVLDSSDEENIIVPPKKKKEKKNRILTSSSGSDSDDHSSDSKSNVSSTQADHPPKPSAAASNIVSNTNDLQKKTALTVPQSLTIKPISNSTAKSDEQPAKNVSVSNAIPNLPKGLVITQIGAGSSSANQTESKLSQPSVNGTKNIDNVAEMKRQAEGSNIPSFKSVANSNSKSAHLVRIKSLNSSVTIKPTENSVIKASDSVTVNQVTNISGNKSVSIMPVISKTLSITPVGSEKKASVSYNTGESASSEQSASKPKNTKSKRKKYDSEEEDDEDYGNEDIYDSEDSECEENLTSAHSAVLKFFQESSADELGTIPGCSKKKAEAIINCRPFSGWADLVEKLKNDKSLSTDMLNGAKKVLDMRNAINKLMTKCQRIALDMEDLVENLKENKESYSGYVSKQPDLLNDRMHLTSYQMLGLNWLLLMHNQEVNGILADEMGLGKTVQAIAFLAYLKEISISGPHLIVVPSSTLDNWKKELQVWWPTVSVICYHGSQESRRELRMQILNDEVDEFDVMITTYNMITSSAEDRSFFKRLEFHYVVFDEAHMLKNMASQRYQHLMRVKAPRRLLLTGTPLQNNLVELMSLLIFAMPHMFSGKTEQIKQMFSAVSKTNENKLSYEKERIDHAKRIMKPFVLRRLKREVLKELPPKHDEIKFCPMAETQAKLYEELVAKFSEEVKDREEKEESYSGLGMMMQLRRAANHPLLLRNIYSDDKLLELSKLMLKEPTHCESDPNLVFEDMSVMSDFELHNLCKTYKALKSHVLSDDDILNSGKFKILEDMLPKFIEEDHRILLFSQFTMVLDVIEEFMNIKGYKFLRLDGQVPVAERQQLIDEFNNNSEIVVFLLSTRAGGLGINLTAADTVILHDIDFNPYNDKQAEDRCHRVGQLRDVRVIRFISENTIEEGILQRAKDKLKLERDIHEENGEEENDIASVAKLLRDALGLKNAKS